MTALSTRALPIARRTSALYCATYGRGAPLLLIHNLGASGQMFQPLIPALSADYTVIVPDLRGHGNSRRLPLAESVGRLAADLDDLLDLLGVEPTFVLGHAGGGAVALQLAREFPRRVRGLVLSSPSALAAPASNGPVGRLRGGLASLLGERAGSCSPTAGHQLLQSFDCRPWLSQIRVPTLVVAGADDAASLARTRELVARLPHGSLEVIPGTDHTLVEAYPDRLVEVVVPWLRRQEAAA